MRKEADNSKLNPSKAFSLNRLDNKNNFETGLSATLGFDYEIREQNRKINLSIGQIFNEKENKKMPTAMGLDEKASDLVGSSKYEINDRFSLNYNFALDQNYSEFNYNEIGAKANLDSFNFDASYLQKKTYWKQRIYKSKIDYKLGKTRLYLMNLREI